ncbi:hypothetical protein [Arenimonas sp.]|uniref:hypothetical protein n=1 Tax=Arenimonas sp. TaxID=1872635 RepID=UPI0039E4F980
MNRGFDRVRHEQVVSRLVRMHSVADCLPYEDMLDVSSEFDRFARNHFSHLKGLDWHDACPAYALGLMTFGTYEMPEDADDLQALWKELCASELDWFRAQIIMLDVWAWLNAHPNDRATEQ